MTTIWLIPGDYDNDPELFATKADALAYCHNTFGPDKTTWPAPYCVKLKQVKKEPAKAYHAIAWWPAERYNEPPTEPYVASAYDEEPVVWDKHSPKFAAQAPTLKLAEAKAVELALVSRPQYLGGFSSNTSAGRLPVFKRQ